METAGPAFRTSEAVNFTLIMLQTFSNNLFGTIRTIVNEKGETFFVGKDVAQALGYSNTRKALRDHVETEDKLEERIVTSGQNRRTILINGASLQISTTDSASGIS